MHGRVFPNVIIDSRPLSICFRPICFVNSDIPYIRFRLPFLNTNTKTKGGHEFSPTVSDRFHPYMTPPLPQSRTPRRSSGINGDPTSRVHKTGETGRKTGTFFLGSVGPVETSENWCVFLATESERFFRYCEPCLQGVQSFRYTDHQRFRYPELWVMGEIF
jgi:hypothetical protein